MIKIELTQHEAITLANHLRGLIGKGMISTTPAWARNIVSKISREVTGIGYDGMEHRIHGEFKALEAESE